MLRTLPRWVCQVTYRGVIHRPRANTRRLGRFFVHSRLVGIGHVSGDLRRSLLGAIGLAAVVAVGGCSGSTSPQTLPSVPASRVGGPPAPAAEKSLAGLQSFVREYYSAISTAARSGDTATLQGLTAPGCTCQAVVDFISRSHKVGGIVGFIYRIERMYSAGIDRNAGEVVVVYDVPRVEVVSTSGQVLQTAPPVIRGTEVVTTIWANRRWYISGVTRLGQ